MRDQRLARRLSLLGLAALAVPFAVFAAGGGGGAWTGAPRIDFPRDDFATCDPDMPTCDAARNDCCVAPLDPIASDRAIIIPLDRCHQTPRGSKFRAPAASSPAWCVNPAPGADDGVFEAYGLVYRLMQNDIPVHWIVNPTKAAPALSTEENHKNQTYIESDIDFWVLSADDADGAPPELGDSLAGCGAGCASPIARLDPATLGAAEEYGRSEFPVRGSAFVIPPKHRAEFEDFWLEQGAYAGLAGNSMYDFGAVDLYEMRPGARIVWQDFRTAGPDYATVDGAPIAATIDYEPPRLARQSPAGVSALWLAKAKLDEPARSPGCKNDDWQPSTAVYCDVTELDVANDVLVDGGFSWAWFDNYKDNSPCATPAERQVVEKFDEFLTADPGVRNAGNVLFQEAAVGVVEGCSDLQFIGAEGVGVATQHKAMSEPFIYRYPSNLFMQFGDYPARFAQGSVPKWDYYGGGATGYDPTFASGGGNIFRLVSEDDSGSGNALCVGHQSTPACDVWANDADADTTDLAVYARHDNVADNGVVFYMGGNQVTQNNNAAHLRMILNALIAMPLGTVDTLSSEPIEVSRSAPVVAALGGIEVQFQGTYEISDPQPAVPTYSDAGDASSFEFPYTKGHLRAFEAESLTSTETAFDDVPALFDAADEIPPANPSGCNPMFSGFCRTVFTNVDTGTAPDTVQLSRSEAGVLQPLVGPSMSQGDVELLIERVLAGSPDGSGGHEPALGGIDRSSMAVIGPSAVAGESDRPTIIYAGGLDGMMHAFCADTTGPACSAVGQELWAYVPRTQLPLLRFNTQRIDGSPKVADVYDDFDDDGSSEWKTVLVFTTGSGDPPDWNRAPAVIALDVTDPEQPSILWEHATPQSRDTYELGVGLHVALGPVRVGGDTRNLAFVGTNNGGTGGAGFVLKALDVADGSAVWTVAEGYPAPRDASNPGVPDSGIPGGPSAVDLDRQGTLTHVVMPTLYGDLWVFEAGDGTNPYGSAPLFRFSEDFHPIGAPATIYRDRTTSRLHAIVVSGGYADPVEATWSPSSETQYAVSVALDTPANTVPVSEETGADFGGNRAFVIDLGTGNRAFGQAIVSGNEVFIVTDSQDANLDTYGLTGGTGTLSRYSLSGGGPIGTSTQIAGGAASVDVREGVVHSGSGSGAQKSDVSGSFDADGGTTELEYEMSSSRALWLLLQ